HTPSFGRVGRRNQWAIAGLARFFRIRAGCWAILMTSGYGYKDFEASPVRSKDSLGPTTVSSKNRGLAAMPAQERSMGIDGRDLGGEPTRNQRQHREAMARNSSPQPGPRQGSGQASGQGPAPRQGQSNPRANSRSQKQWDEADWDQDQDAAGHRARKLLSGSGSGIHRVGALRR